jgi:hypothetical protein
MNTTDDRELCHWLERFQRLDWTDEQIAGPGKTAAAFAEIIGGVATGMAFDTDPASFGKRLLELAPDDQEEQSK